MSPWVAVAFALAAVLTTHLVARLGERVGPRWIVPARGPSWVLAAALIALGTGVAGAFGTSWLAFLSPRLGIAAAGPAGAFAALALALAALMLGATLIHLIGVGEGPRRAPSRAWTLLFGVASDGDALEGVRRPLRWGVNVLVVALLASLGLIDDIDPVGWALALSALVALGRSLARPWRPEAPTAKSAASALAPASVPDLHTAFHVALGRPELFEHEPAIVATHDFAEAIVDACAIGRSPRLVAVQAPDGAGKSRAARLVAARLAERGLTTLWIGPPGASDEPAHVQRLTLADLSTVLARGTTFPRLGLLVVEARVALSGEALAILRYGLHRIVARERVDADLLVLGGATSIAVARAIGAAEPRVVTPSEPLPTKPILRYLLPAAPEPRLAASPPSDTCFVAFDRPAPPRRHPDALSVAREYLVPAPGPLGRRMRVDRAASIAHGRAPRLLVALPGDRETPERQDGLARFHLRAALAEAPQDPTRLRAVFSPALVDAELAALARAGLSSKVDGWVPTDHGVTSAPRIGARLPHIAAEAPPTVSLVEPRSARSKVVSRARLDFECYDGAITTLDPGPTAERFEVRGAAGSEHVLLPTALVAAAPLRTLAATFTEAPKKARLRFRGARDLEVWEGAVAIRALHHGVRQFAGTTAGEGRAYTRYLPEPIALPPLATAARALVFGDEPAPASAALHALAHALREVLPCFFENAADLGVTFETASSSLGRNAIILFDAHPDGLGAAADLRDDDLEALLAGASELLECACAAHCASCCESTSCSLEGAPLDRKEALRVLHELVVPRPIPLGVRAHAALLRRTG